jgi:phosphoribosylformylglycinamidine synthase
VLANNNSAKYECRWVRLKVESKRTPFTSALNKDQVIAVPVGHGEGRLVLQSEGMLEDLISERQVVFRYALEDGSPAGGKYPENPNGAIFDIAGICNKKGNVWALCRTRRGLFTAGSCRAGEGSRPNLGMGGPYSRAP